MSSENYAFASSPQREAMLHFKEQTLLNRTQLGSWLSKLLAWSSGFSSIKWRQWYELCRDVIVEVKIPQSAYCLLWYLAHIRHSKHLFPVFLRVFYQKTDLFLIDPLRSWEMLFSWLWHCFVSLDYLLSDITVKLFNIPVTVVSQQDASLSRTRAYECQHRVCSVIKISDECNKKMQE